MGSRKDELIAAVKANDERKVWSALAFGASPNAVDKNDPNKTPALMIAIQNGNETIIDHLLSGATELLGSLGFGKSKEDPERFTAKIQIKYADANGTTPLMLVAQKNNQTLLERFLELPDVDEAINAVDKIGKSALYYAAVNNNGDMLQSLVEAGANPNNPNLLMTLINEGNEQAALSLLNNVPSTRNNSKTLELAFTRNPTLSGVVDFLLNHNYVPIEDVDTLKDSNGWDLLSWAIQRDHYDFAQRWVSTTELTVTNSTLPLGTEAVSPMKQLVQSIREGNKLNLEQISLLTSLMAQPQNSFSANDYARGRECLTEVLVPLFKELKGLRTKEKGDLNKEEKRNVIQKIKTCQVQIEKIIKLAKQGKLNLNYTNAKGDPLHVELIQLGYPNTLLENVLDLPGLDINVKGNSGSALLHALKTEQWDLALKLIENKRANANDTDTDKSAFAYIIKHIVNSDLFSRYIQALEAGTDFNELIKVGFGPEVETGLMYVIRTFGDLINTQGYLNDTYIMKLIDKTNLNFQDKEGDTVLTQMISKPRDPRHTYHEKITQKLLVKGAAEGLINHPKREKFLINAVKNGYYDVLFHMLQNSNTVEADITAIVDTFNKEGTSISPDLKKVLIYHKLRVNNKNPDDTLADFKKQLKQKSGKNPTGKELLEYRNKLMDDYGGNTKFVNALNDDVNNKENGLIQYLFPDRYANYMEARRQAENKSEPAIFEKPTQALAPPMEPLDQSSSSSSSSSTSSVIHQEPYAQSLNEATAKLYHHLVDENAKLREALQFIPDESTEPSAPPLENAPETTNPIETLLAENIRLKTQLSEQSKSSSTSTTSPIVNALNNTRNDLQKEKRPEYPPSYDEAPSRQLKHD